MSDKKSVSAFRVLRSAFSELQDDPFMYIILLAPIYILTGISLTYNDFIIVHNEDFEYYKYSFNSYNIGLIYIFLESYIFAVVAVAIHNKIIRREITFKFLSKGTIIYFLFYFFHYAEFLLNYFSNNLILSVSITLTIIYSLVGVVLGFTFFLWLLYLPNISVNDKHSFFYIVKNSYGARLTMIIQAIYIIPIFLIPYMIIAMIGGYYLGVIFTYPFIFILGITMLSCTYLEWKELEKNTAENNK